MGEDNKLSCLFGCDARDALDHYIVCPILWLIAGSVVGHESSINLGERMCFHYPSVAKLQRLAVAHFVYHACKNDNTCISNSTLASPLIVQDRAMGHARAAKVMIGEVQLDPVFGDTPEGTDGSSNVGTSSAITPFLAIMDALPSFFQNWRVRAPTIDVISSPNTSDNQYVSYEGSPVDPVCISDEEDCSFFSPNDVSRRGVDSLQPTAVGVSSFVGTSSSINACSSSEINSFDPCPSNNNDSSYQGSPAVPVWISDEEEVSFDSPCDVGRRGKVQVQPSREV